MDAARRLLLIIDNCEHLLGSAADVVRAIVAGCPNVRVLATSREPLGVPGETVHVVPPLDAAIEAADLFFLRATATDDSAVFDDTDRAAIRAICARLDGLPLAIELAAARVRSLSPSDLLLRLDDRFRLFRGAVHGVSERQQTLRATVAWSYQLLDDHERLLFDRMSVFAGSFDLAAAESVCSDGVLDSADVTDLLGSLVEKSMVVADRSTNHASRFRILETLRQFGHESLVERAEADLLRSRHLAHYSDVALRAGQLYRGPSERDAAAMFVREWDNLRAAYTCAIASGEIDNALTVVEACQWFATCWFRFEHAEWVEATLRSAGSDHRRRSTLLGFAALWRIHYGSAHEAIRLATDGLRVSTSDAVGESWCCQALALSYLFLGRGNDALALARQAVTAAAGDSDLQCIAIRTAVLAAGAADKEEVAELAARHRTLAAVGGSPFEQAHVAYFTGYAELAFGHTEEACRWFERCSRLAEGSGPFIESVAMFAMAEVSLLKPDENTSSVLREAIVRMYDTRNWHILWLVIEALAIHWVRTGHHEHGAILLGHLEGLGQSNAAFLDDRVSRAEYSC